MGISLGGTIPLEGSVTEVKVEEEAEENVDKNRIEACQHFKSILVKSRDLTLARRAR